MCLDKTLPIPKKAATPLPHLQRCEILTFWLPQLKNKIFYTILTFLHMLFNKAPDMTSLDNQTPKPLGNDPVTV